MSREELNNFNKLSVGSTLWRALCILLIVAILVVLSVSGVYAKYATSDNSSNSANVAGVGVEIFNLVEHGKAVAGADYSKVIPGVDIPGPHVQLKINSEVSYTLYLQITTRNFPIYINVDGEQVKVVYFDVTDNWELINTVEVGGNTTYTYKYVVDNTDNTKNYVFKAGVEHTYVEANEITVLKDDVIYVSERYSELYGNSENLSFLLKFEAYIQQVL